MAGGSSSYTLNIKALFDASSVKAGVNEIQNSLKSLKLPDKLAADLNSSFTNVNKALDDFVSKAEKGIKTKGDANGITKSFETVTKELTKLDNLMIKVKSQLGEGADLSKIIKLDDKTINEIKSLEQDISQLQQKLSSINTSKLSEIKNLLGQIKTEGAQMRGGEALQLFEEGKTKEAIAVLDNIIVKLQRYEGTATEAANSLKLLGAIRTQMANAAEESGETIIQIDEKTAQAAQKATQAWQSQINQINQGSVAIHGYQQSAVGAGQAIIDLTSRQQQFVNEVDQVKSRIQYFFGLANSINLVKRAVRSAVDTIKDLDKAMTATAVVTDFTVSDMWKQLPEYTKRANQLGVTTQAAYEAATLFYQQGLNTQQAAELSTETLKMARIAGLDAAEATDRMTNALRGFNMALDAESAQRVDDVYSQLAAHTASNVDEISTAMTKVASLAHSANMEFETTAAFLSQIIETTRESAETAGTALKTVVARFSEVKKLVDQGQLRGADEEGQVIDVNRVGTALRTAGIDLNKYFLGEVGLDDIFMELASKWDTLTSVQQRYIATQAAGSRQQSRFIALMQDYARTQELVGLAYDAQGASARQFAKTQESLESKLARLKNAWNEFLMGITNNVVVKAVVDGLTTLLNVINSLTSAFGDGAGSVLKFATALALIGGMRSLFSNGGVGLRVLGALAGSGLLGKEFNVRAGLAKWVTDEAGNKIGYKKFTSQELREQASGTRFPIITGIGNIGKSLWGGAQNLGMKVMRGSFANIGLGGTLTNLWGPEVVAGLTGISTAISAIGAAIVVATLAYKAWLNITPEGQLKKATKEAEKLKKQAEESQKELDSLNDLQDIYKQKTEQLESAQSTEEYKKAVEERNEAVLNQIKTNGTLAQYVKTTRTEFGIELTVNKESLSNAIEDASKAAQDAAIQSQFANAQVGYAQAQVDQKELRKLWMMATGATGAEAQVNFTPQEYFEQIMKARGVSGELSSKATAAYQSYLSSIGSARKAAEIGYGQELTNRKVDKDLTNALIPFLGDIFEQTGKKLSDESLDKLLDIDQDNLQSILDAIAGNIDFSSEDIDKVQDSLNLLATALGKEVSDIEQQIKKAQEVRKKITKQNRANIYEQALRNGLTINKQFFDQVQGLGFEKSGIISNILTSAKDALSQQGIQQLLPDLLKMGEEDLQQFTDFFSNFNLDDSINAFKQLKSAQEDALTLPEDEVNNAYRAMLTNIEQANSAVFDTGNLVQTFLTSTSYDSLTDSIEKFIDANGKLTAANIEELAASCSELQTLLKNTTVTAQGLAAAFTLFQNSDIPIDSITSSLLAAFSAGESFETLLDGVSKWISDFNEGTDLKEGTNHITDILEKATDYVYNWEFGNKPLENIYNHLFGMGETGKGAYAEYMDQFWGNAPIDEIEAKIQGDIDRIKALAENEGRGALEALIGKTKGEIRGENGEYSWDLSAYDSASAAIQDVADNLGIAEDAARSFIEAWGSHMYNLRTEWDNLNFKDQMQAFSDSLTSIGDNAIVTEQEIDALAKATGKNANEIKTAIESASGQILIEVNWQDGNGGAISGDELITRFQDTLNQLGSSYNDLASQFRAEVSDKIGRATPLLADAIDFSGLNQYLTQSLKLTSNQAKEVANDITSQTGKNLTQEIKVPVKLDENTFGTEAKVITATSAEALQAGIDAAMEAANYELVSEELADATDFSTVTSKLTEALRAGASTLSTAVEAAATGVSVTIPVYWEAESLPTGRTGGSSGRSSGSSSGSGGGHTRASGGIIGSYAKGSENFHVSPGTALTGEEGPEIVWNKNQGYAYVTGSKGPEFQNLQPGDRVFNASETKEIFKNSSLAKGGKVKSFANAEGSWNDRGPRNEKGNAATNEEKTPEEWKNELDWLYNLMEDLVQLGRDQKALEERYEDLLTDQNATGHDLYKILVERLANLQYQLSLQQLTLEKREEEMREFMDTTNDQDEYLKYNWNENTLEIDWDAIEQINDKELYDHIKELVEEAETIQDKIDNAEDAIIDINNQIQELEDIWRDEYIDFEKRVLDAIIKSRQKIIDNYTDLNETLTNTNNEILSAIQEQVTLQRQIRDNTNTEQDIGDKQSRLSYLQRDTTGANAQEILALQQEIENDSQSYQDKLVDQALSRLQDDAAAAAEQRDLQIQLMQAQLDYQIQNGEFYDDVERLIAEATDATGKLVQSSELVSLLKQAEDWDGMSETQKEKWVDGLDNDFKQATAYIELEAAKTTKSVDELGKVTNVFDQDVQKAIGNLATKFNESIQSIGSKSQPEVKNASESKKESSGSSSGSSSSSNGGSSNTNNNSKKEEDLGQDWGWSADENYHWHTHKYKNVSTGAIRTEIEDKGSHKFKIISKTTQACTICGYVTAIPNLDKVIAPEFAANELKKKAGKTYMAYATGGLNTQTGLAWLDGTPQEPEYVLNARQTEAFLKLADVLPTAKNGSISNVSNSPSNIYLNLDMHVDEIGSDYDVDRIANRVKDIIYDASSYRNVNTINFIR